MISIIVATFNRPSLCERSLRSVVLALRNSQADSPLSFEILVCINGKDSETHQLLLRLQKEKLPHLRFFNLETPLTPGACRNFLISQAKGDWIYFLDDDAYVDSDFFLKWNRTTLKENCVAVGGPNLNPPQANFFQNVASHSLASPFATYFSSDRYVPSGSPRLCSEASLILCNLFVKRDALNQAPFLERLFCAEENWMLQDLKREGHLLGYDPSLFVWHERRPDVKSFIEQVFKYGYGRGQIFRRRRWGLHPAHLLPSLCVIYTLALISWSIVGSPVSMWLLLPFPIYFLLCGFFAWKTLRPPRDLSRMFVTGLLFPVIHTNYGLGFLWGWVRG